MPSEGERYQGGIIETVREKSGAAFEIALVDFVAASPGSCCGLLERNAAVVELKRSKMKIAMARTRFRASLPLWKTRAGPARTGRGDDVAMFRQRAYRRHGRSAERPRTRLDHFPRLRGEAGRLLRQVLPIGCVGSSTCMGACP